VLRAGIPRYCYVGIDVFKGRFVINKDRFITVINKDKYKVLVLLFLNSY
jgi:hypothetical protein